MQRKPAEAFVPFPRERAWKFLRACRPYFAAEDPADCLHAAACLQAGAILVSNDRHFERIGRAGIVEHITASGAIRRWMPSRRK